MHDSLALRPQTRASRANDDQDICLNGSLAGRALAAAIDGLDPLRGLVLGWQLGLHGPVSDVTTISSRLAIPVERVDRLIIEALEELGWELVSPTSAASDAEVAA